MILEYQNIIGEQLAYFLFCFQPQMENLQYSSLCTHKAVANNPIALVNHSVICPMILITYSSFSTIF